MLFCFPTSALQQRGCCYLAKQCKMYLRYTEGLFQAAMSKSYLMDYTSLRRSNTHHSPNSHNSSNSHHGPTGQTSGYNYARKRSILRLSWLEPKPMLTIFLQQDRQLQELFHQERKFYPDELLVVLPDLLKIWQKMSNCLSAHHTGFSVIAMQHRMLRFCFPKEP